MAEKAKSSSCVPSARPEDVRALLMDGDTPSDWFAANRRHNRFFVVNLDTVMGQLGVEYTRTAPFFHGAAKAISTDTKWQQQYAFEYYASHTQIRPEARYKPKEFGRAVAIILAMELLAREKKPDFDVYAFLRVLPATFFVDRFDKKALTALRQADPEFDQKALAAIEQPLGKELLSELAAGHCVTRYTAEKLIKFVNSHYPEGLHVGPVRASGEDAFSYQLGQKNAAPSLRVPRAIPSERLPPLESPAKAPRAEC